MGRRQDQDAGQLPHCDRPARVVFPGWANPMGCFAPGELREVDRALAELLASVPEHRAELSNAS